MNSSAPPIRNCRPPRPPLRQKDADSSIQTQPPVVDTSGEPAPKLRVLIADHHPLAAEALAKLLASEYEIVGFSADGRRLLTDAAVLKPDLVVLDIDLPELNGVEAARHLTKLVPAARLVFLSQQVDLLELRAVLAARGLGYVARQSAASELIPALHMAGKGRHYLSSQLKSASSRSQSRRPPMPLPWLPPELTVRQRQVLQMVAEGMTTREISAALHISPKTVEFHRAALMNHTGLRSTAELTRFAIATGIVPPNPLQDAGY